MIDGSCLKGATLDVEGGSVRGADHGARVTREPKPNGAQSQSEIWTPPEKNKDSVNTVHEIHSKVHDVPELFIRKAVDDVVQAFPVQNIDDPDSEAEKPDKNTCGESPNLTHDKQLTLTH